MEIFAVQTTTALYHPPLLKTAGSIFPVRPKMYMAAIFLHRLDKSVCKGKLNKFILIFVITVVLAYMSFWVRLHQRLLAS